MAPDSFTFKLTVPNDPAGATVVGVVASHAATYTQLDAAKGAAFVERVKSAASHAMKAADGKPCLVVFAAEAGQLSVTIGDESVSEPLPS
jgi:hypothetical protein